MKRRFYFVFIIVGLIGIFPAFAPGEKGTDSIKTLDMKGKSIDNGGKVKLDVNFGKIPLYFIHNKGQVNKKTAYYARASRYTLWITKEGLVFDSSYSPHSTKYQRDVSRLMFIKANKNPQIIPLQRTKLRVNYFKGNNPAKWHCDVPTSQAVLYKNLYKNIDLKVYGIEKQIEYDWIVKPGGNSADIRLRYTDVKGTRLDKEGNLIIETDFGELVHKKPVGYQRIDVGAGPRACPKEREDINITFKKICKNTYGFDVGEYDKERELIIDPVIMAYSTYLGGEGDDYGYGIAVDSSGNAYVTGYTESTDFPILNQYQTDQTGVDVFVTKIDTTQAGTSSLIYSTYLGGEGWDKGQGIAVDNSGKAYVTGTTASSDFPTLNQYQGHQGSYDTFLIKLDTTQSGVSSLIYSTYLGGTSNEGGYGITADSSGNAYVTGRTYSADFPTLNQYQTDQFNVDVFVTRIDTTQSGTASLVYSTYLGGDAEDQGRAIAIDSSGYVYVSGFTKSTDFPTLNQYQTDPDSGDYDAFVTRLDTTKSGTASLIYSTYLGGTGGEIGHGISVDNSGCAYVAGDTSSTDFPLLNQYQTDQTGSDAFVTKIDTTQSGSASLIYSTYLGGNMADWGYAIAVDSLGYAYVTGCTYSSNFPTLNPIPGQGVACAYVTKIDTTQSGSASLIYSTYLGGNNKECGNGISVDSSGNAYVTGYTESTDFPVINQYLAYPGGNKNAFVTRLNTFPDPSITVTCPNGGESWPAGLRKTITWTCESVYGKVDIEYSTNNGESWIEIATGTPNDGSRLWTVPNTVSDQCLLRICETDGSPADTSDQVFSIEQTPFITVTSPNGGEQWQIGSSQTITWTSEGTVGNVMIECSFDGGTAWKTIAVSTENDGEFPWITPNKPSDNCLIRVSASDPDEGVEDVSDAVFAIVSPVSGSINVTSPNGGESWATGSSQVIKWNSSGDISNVTIDYSTDNGTTWKTIVQTTGNDGSFNWTVPDTPSDQCLVRVTGNDSDPDSQPSDVSDEVFSIEGTSPPFIRVISPNGGESWTAGSSQEIKWTSNGDINNVAIHYSADNGVSWKTIVQTTGNDGSFNWNVPGTASDQCLVRVIGNDNDLDPKPSDVSDGVFSIVLPSPPTISVTAPNGGEQLIVGSRFDITWFSNGTREDVKIEYSVNGGQTWEEIAGAADNNGSYDWTVPDTPSETCLVRVGEIDGQPQDVSDAVFSIVSPLPDGIAVRSPNGGESWVVMSSQEITWTAGGDINNVTIEYSYDNGKTWDMIVQTTANDGSFDWTVPDTVSEECLVRVTAADGVSDPRPSDVSDNIFSIVLPPPEVITVTAPNGGEQLIAGSRADITWFSSGIGEEVKIEYSLNGGETWTVISSAAENDGHHDWTVPDEPSEICLVRIGETGGPLMDISDAVFSIVSPQPYGITVTSPNGGENWIASSSQVIKWTSTGGIDNVTIEYSYDNGTTWKTIVQTTPNDGSFDWTVPDTVSDDCLVRVTGHDNDLDPKPWDVSDGVFSIVPPSPGAFRVTSPNGGEEWEVGSIQTITWDRAGDIGSVMIEYSFDNGGTWKTVASSTTNSGSYNWPVPDTVSADCLVRVTANDGGVDPRPSDVSDELFSIVRPAEPTIRVISPNGGEELVVGSRFTITWYASDSREEAKIEYSVNGGESWAVITAATQNDGEYDWTVPGEPSETCLVRISETDGQPLDISDAVFSIVSPAAVITVTSANGGENWAVGSSQEIKWTCTGDISNVTIDYSTDNGTTWKMIAQTTVNNGSYNWTVPDTVSDECLVRVTAADDDLDPRPWDVSDEVFSIVSALPGAVRVTSPNGGEEWEVASNQTITWNSTGDISSVKIEYSTDNGSTWSVIVPSTTNSGAYNWSVPNTVSTDCLVRITGDDDVGDPDPSDVSDEVFSIVLPPEPTLRIMAPNGGEELLVGSRFAITWLAAHSTENITITYSTNGGQNWKGIIESTPNNGHYDWIIPDDPSDNCLVRIEEIEGQLSDVSDAVFTILSPSSDITVKTPNGGENLEAGTEYDITWDSTGVDNVVIKYSTDNGVNWTTIGTAPAAEGTYTWLVPGTPSETCRVQVTAIDATLDPRPSDMSDNVFTIVLPATGAIRVDSPNGGETLTTGSQYDITWTSTGVTNAIIEYSTDNGAEWIYIDTVPASNGSYTWTIPQTPSSTCLVRISGSTPGVPPFDVSDDVFSIIAI